MSFNQELFERFIIDNDVIGFFEEPVTFKSGRSSYWYVNWRIVSNDAFLLKQLCSFIRDFVADLERSKAIPHVDTIYGVPESVTKAAVITQLMRAEESKEFGKGSHRISMGRAKPKSHGVDHDRYFVGAPTGNVLVLEDVTTTGASLIQAIDTLYSTGCNVIGAISFTNRCEVRDDGLLVGQAVVNNGTEQYFAMSEAPSLLKILRDENKIPERFLKELPFK